jgi:hypothetical protein
VQAEWRQVLEQRAAAFVGTVLFPRFAYWLRWPTRLGPRGLIAYIAFNTAVLFAVRVWLIPRMKRWAAERDRVVQELREKLGREPTEGDWFDYYQRRNL